MEHHLSDFRYTHHMQTPVIPHDPTDLPLIRGEWTQDVLGQHTETRMRWVFPQDAPKEWTVVVAHESLNPYIATVYLLVNDIATLSRGAIPPLDPRPEGCR